MLESSLTINIGSVENGKQIIALHGALDKAGLQKVRDQILQCVDSSSAIMFVFDFAELEFLNSEAIGFLVSLQAHVQKKDQRIVITGMNAHIRDVFETVGLLSLFEA